MQVLGIDIGGSGIKGAPVDLDRGKLLSARVRIETPQPAKPAAVAKVFAELVAAFDWKGPVGVGFPGIMRRNVAHSAANLHPSWVGRDLGVLFKRASKCPVAVINDADAAGLAEVNCGAGKGRTGSIVLLTLGTGIGSALFIDGRLYPNSEFGHLCFGSSIAEKYAASSIRKAGKLTWNAWGARLNDYLVHLNRVIFPDLIILGGGVSAKFAKYRGQINCGCEVVPAKLKNNAGIIGAALAAPR